MMKIFRKGAIIPFALFSIGIFVFTYFFFDSLLKWGLEKGLTSAIEAEANIKEVKTSFLNLDLEIKGIALTNKEKPDFNIVEIGMVKFKLLPDAILRGKIVIDESSIKDILVESKRTKRGFVVQKKVSEASMPKDETSEKIKKEAINVVKKENKENIFSDIASLLGGAKSEDLAKAFEGNLESKKRFEELGLKLKEKEIEFQKVMANLPKDHELKDLEKRSQGINLKDLSNLGKMQKTLKEIDSLKKDIDKALKSYDTAKKTIDEDLKFLENAPKGIDKLIATDIENAKKKLKLPSLDPKKIALSLFEKELEGKVREFEGYYYKIEKYLPPKKSKEEKEASKLIPRKRGEGKNYEFGTPKSYPLFWLKLASINSKSSDGEMRGEIRDVTTNQKITSKKTTALFKGEFIGKSFKSLAFDSSLDYRDTLELKLNASLGGVIIDKRPLSESNDATFNLLEGVGSSDANFLLEGKNINFNFDSKVTNVKFETASPSKDMLSLLNQVASEANVVTLQGKGRGTLKDLKLDVSSNLATIIQKALEKTVKAKIDEVSKEVQTKITSEVNKVKDLYEKNLKNLKTSSQDKIEAQKAELQKNLKKIKV